MKFEEKYGRVVMDHLSPEAPSLEGLHSYYVPDLSYDSYAYNGAYWVLTEDVIKKVVLEVEKKASELESK